MISLFLEEVDDGCSADLVPHVEDVVVGFGGDELLVGVEEVLHEGGFPFSSEYEGVSALSCI